MLEDRNELAQKSPVTQANVNRHVFVCTGKSCTARGSEATLDRMREVLAAKGLLYGKRGSFEAPVIVTSCGSVGLCQIGPAVLCYPEGTWYYNVTEDQVEALVESHFERGEILEPLHARDFPAKQP